MSNTVISIENLTKRYDLGVIGTGTLSRDLNRWWARLRGKPDPYTRIGQRDHFELLEDSIFALDDVSFTVRQGEALGIIGKNGAGKSTLLKILSRVTAPTSGVVKVKGRIGSLLEVGTGFHPELTGKENIFLNGAILGMNKSEVQKKLDEIVDFSGVEKFIDTPVKRYSSGMYVRLAFAVAAHLDPEILVVDEVLAVGDAEFQKKCLGKMGDVAGEGRTVLFVSHNMTAITNLCEKAILLDQGKLCFSGECEKVVSKYFDNIINKNRKVVTKRKDRTGNGEAKFTSFSITHNFGELPSDHFETGDKLIISMEIESNKNMKAFIAIHMKDPSGKKISCFNSREGDFTPNLNIGKTKINMLVPWLSILEGEYFFDCAIVESSNFSLCDKILDVTSILVTPKDIYEAGVAFRAYHGVTIVPHIWLTDKGEKVEVLPTNSRTNLE